MPPDQMTLSANGADHYVARRMDGPTSKTYVRKPLGVRR
jgi:hypothetical protein